MNKAGFVNVENYVNLSADMKNHINQNRIKKIKCIVQVMGLVFFINTKLYSQQISDTSFINKISNAFESGNANLLAELMHNKIDMAILGESGIYSNQQAKYILTEFFEENIPEQFIILSNDANQNNTCLIGKALINGQFHKIYILIKVINNENSIYQIRIEK